MHIPKQYREHDRGKILSFLRHNSFAALVSFDGQQLLVTHTPVEVAENEGGGLTIYGHMSRANPQWKTLGAQEVLLIFQGAHTYISPRWYNHLNVPTWNYMMVHVHGNARLVQEGELADLLNRLVATHEVNTSYSFDALPQEFVDKEIKGVMGFAVEVTRIDAGYKLSQNRNDEDHANILRELEQRGDANSVEVARVMREQRQPHTAPNHANSPPDP